MSRIIFVGGSDLGCMCLDYLLNAGHQVALVVARADDTGEDGIFPSLLKLAEPKGIKCVRDVRDLNAAGLLALAERARADIVFSAQNQLIFGAPWLDLFGMGRIVNAHPAPLPRYAGFWPEMWAIFSGEPDFGVTWHFVDGGVDTGDVIEQMPVEILEDDTRKTLYEKCKAALFSLFVRNLDAILTGTVERRPQDLTQRTYFHRGLPNDGFVDFSWDSQKIRRFYRALAFSPFPGAKIQVGDQVITSVAEDLAFFRPVKVSPWTK